jgi:hypothetical protein
VGEGGKAHAALRLCLARLAIKDLDCNARNLESWLNRV